MKSPENMTAEELEQLENRIRKTKNKLAKKLSEDNRKALDHAKIFIGGMVLSHFEEDWRSVNFEKLAAYFEKYSGTIKQLTCEELPLDEAKKRLRNYEVKHNAWDSYGKDPETAEAMTAEMYGEVVAEGKQGLEDNFGYPQAPAKSVAPGSPAASSTPQNQTQSADALGVDFGAFSPFVE